jgi:hypothetical protein
MKKITVFVIAMVVSIASFSQGNSHKTKLKNNDKMHKMHKEKPNGVMMQNGRMMMIMKGKTSYLENEVTMSNGTRVLPNGTCIKKDGSTMMMMEGQHMNLGGNMIPMKNHKMKH